MDKRHLLNFWQLSAHYKRRITLVCVLLVSCTALVSEGRVFLRWGAASNLARFVSAIGGKQAYSADFAVNGKQARITVYGLPQSNRAWVNNVRSISFDHGIQRTTLTGLNLAGASLLFHYESQESNHAAQNSLSSLPLFPQSKQVFLAHDENADMHVSISSSHAAPEQVRDYYRKSMQAAGWHIPAVSLATKSQGMAVFIREQEVACVAADRLHDKNETQITLLHKKLRIK